MFIEDPVFMESLLDSMSKEIKENSKIKRKKDELAVQSSLSLLEVKFFFSSLNPFYCIVLI